MSKHFSAPWSTTVKIVTGVLVAICIGISWISGPVIGIVPIAILIVCAIFSVRGYSVSDGEVLVHRLGWSNRFSGSEIDQVEFEPGAMSGSIRTFGIGGLFGFTGHFRNSLLGPYRAYATDPKKSVVIKYGDRTIVVTPNEPEEFVAAVSSLMSPDNL